ncbi:hypothetical protein O3M35_005719 [Rhynocoris fuscipes]|uniref:ABC transporter domain-containing protein n=1 Tax=Rhynocoris fuscipes TaxID=488301 RepID=A0AAW1DKH7_9HEMI
MSFWLQLRLILWKNAVQRKRQKVRLFIELMWPLILFLILMWVRTRGLRKEVHECHFTEKALPSTGLFPFIQSIICTFNNTCHLRESDAQVKFGNLTTEGTLEFLRELFNITSYDSDRRSIRPPDYAKLSSVISNLRLENSRENGLSLKQLISKPDDIYQTILKNDLNISENSLDKFLNYNVTHRNYKISPLFFIYDSHFQICNEFQGTDDFFEEFCDLTDEQKNSFQTTIIRELNKSVNTTQLRYYFDENLDKYISWNDWNQMITYLLSLQPTITFTKEFVDAYENFQNTNQIEKIVSLIFKFFCGNNTFIGITDIMNSGGKSTRFDSLQDQFRNRSVVKYQYDDQVSPDCNELFATIESDETFMFIWRIVKPFIVGQILYAPITPATEKIMKSLNDTFEPFVLLKNFLIKTFPQNTSRFFNDFNRNLLVVQDFFNSSLSEKLLNSNYTGIDRESYLILVNDAIRNSNTNRRNSESNVPIKNSSERISLQRQSSNRNAEMFKVIGRFAQCFESNKIRGFNDTDAAEKEGMNLIAFNKLWAVIEFESAGQDKLSPLVTYKIRMNTERVDNTEYILDRLMTLEPRRRPGIDLKYLTYGFAYLQDSLDHIIIKEHTGRSDLPGTIFKQFPYPCYIDDEFIMAISRTFPLFMVLSWSYSCAMIVKSIVYEKEQRLKETMRVMGLGNGIHWLGWFIDSLIPMCVTLVALVIILVYGKVLINSDPFVLYLFLFCYALSTIAQAFLISVFFSRANLAAACAGIIFFIVYLPYPFLARWMTLLTPLHKSLLSLSANVALGVGTAYIAFYEEQGIGMHWDNIDKSPIFADEFNFTYVICFLLLDFVIYLILTWYIEAVFPGQYGIPRPWYFPFTASYWTGKEVTKIYVDDVGVKEEINDDNFEKDPADLKVGVSIRNLKKVFDKQKVAVNDISLSFYEGQITSFLGHNGAGKTTTISMLTGLFPPSSGTAVINGYDIRTDMNKVRKNLGMCPQHNVLFNRLTVEEHLWFYGMIRCADTKKAEFIRNEIEEMLVDLGLPHKRDALSSTLSGGMQRKLSVAVAFIGGSRTVILDEPTSGVDPYSRRSIWELLIKYKQGKTVILTTHYMDEADLLGDRIAIIASGKLICCGTSLFLKRRFGSGYHLTVELASYSTISKPIGNGDIVYDTQGNGVSNIQNAEELNDVKEDQYNDIKALTTHIQNIVPSAKYVEHIGNEVLYILPEENISLLGNLCDSLDTNSSKFNMVSYGISDTSLEEIFIRVAETGEISVQDNLDYKRKNSQIPFVEENNDSKISSSSKFWRQFIALHTKRFLHTIRNKKGLFSELVLPALFICMSLGVTSILPKLEERPPLELSLWKYPAPRYMFFFNNATHGALETKDDTWSDRYVDSILGHDGLGTYCMITDGKRNPNCKDHSVRSRSSVKPNMPFVQCTCSSGGQVCPANIDEPPLPSYQIVSGDTLFNATDQNVSNWIVNTWPKYTMSRLGGYTTGANVTVPSLKISDIARFFYENTSGNMRDILSKVPFSTNFFTPANKNNIKVWFNNKGWISSVAYMNAINNVVLRSTLAAMNSTQNPSLYGIRTINHPMNFTKKQMDIELIRQSAVSILHTISIIFALSFVPASFTLYLIEERVSKSKHLLLVSGVSRLFLWIEEFIWDIVAYTVSAFLCLLIFFIFNEKSYTSSTNLPGVIVLFLLYGWACIPLMYLFSYVFTVPSSAFVGLACGNMFVGIVTTVTTFVLGAFEDEELKSIHDIIKEVFLIFPHFCLGSGLMDLVQNHIASASLMSLDIEYTSNIFEWGLLGKPLLCLFVLGTIFFSLTLAIEYKLFARYSTCLKGGSLQDIIDDDEEDVGAERERVNKDDTKDDVLVIKELTKIYGSNKIPSVKRITVGIKQGECFGLLGINGAGKTTTFKMLTGATSVTSGDATVKGFSVVNSMSSVHALLGYCPQFDALDPLLTPREHLILYGRVKNIPSTVLSKKVDYTLHQMGLGFYSNKLSGTLSGGNKRKLSAAIALIGNPPLVFLDEPTTGMDPKARRYLWTKIQEVVRKGTCVVLTSHSMEECQALCTRLVIMVNGTFKCIGSSQHLKNKYGGGYRLVIRCKEDNVETLKSFMSYNIKSSQLIEEHYNQLRYDIPDGKLSDIFTQLEKGKRETLLEDYSLSQTTLEEVFLRFASEQTNEIIVGSGHRPAIIKKCLSCFRGNNEQ